MSLAEATTARWIYDKEQRTLHVTAAARARLEAVGKAARPRLDAKKKVVSKRRVQQATTKEQATIDSNLDAKRHTTTRQRRVQQRIEENRRLDDEGDVNVYDKMQGK